MAASSQPTVVSPQEDDFLSESSIGSQELADKQNLPDPEVKVMEYNYQETTEKLGEYRMAKFKNGANPTK